MALDAWLPIGFKLPDGAKVRAVLFEGLDWQIYETMGGGRALVARDALVQHWLESGLVDEGALDASRFGDHHLRSISSAPSQMLCPVNEGKSPDNKSEALSFALALKATRDIDVESPLQDALYIEKITRLLPTYSISSRAGDDVVLGYWLTGGTNIPATSFRRLRQSMSWLGAGHLKDVVKAAGFEVAEIIPLERKPGAPSVKSEAASTEQVEQIKRAEPEPNKPFELAGRPELAAFFNEHIVDIILHRERYKALGIEFLSAVILHGPPG